MESAEFLDKVSGLIDEYQIKQIKEKTSDKDACRIALLVNNQYLESVDTKDPNHTQFIAYVLERQVYEGSKELHLSCDLIPEEERLDELHWDKRKGQTPLKLSCESLYKYQPEQRLKLGESVLNILQEVSNGTRQSQNQSNPQTSRSRKVLRGV